MNSEEPWHHGGMVERLAQKTGRPISEWLDFSANINPLGPPRWLRSEIDRNISRLCRYPDPHCQSLTQALASRLDVNPHAVVWGNGADQLIFAAVASAGGQLALCPEPCYSDYLPALKRAGFAVRSLLLQPENGIQMDGAALGSMMDDVDLVVLGNPNNPTGKLIPEAVLREFCTAHPKTRFLIDEAFVDFAGEEASLLPRPPSNVMVLRSMTKFFAIPGLRLGFALGSEPWISDIRRELPSWPVNTLAQAVGTRALADLEYSKQTLKLVDHLRAGFVEKLESIPGLRIVPGVANFLLIGLEGGLPSARNLAERLLVQGIAIRVFPEKHPLARRYIRLAVRPEGEQLRFIGALADIVKLPKSILRTSPKPRPAIMFQGSGSNVGKTVMAAAFCRILVQDGFHVAPFKAQNMSLNAYVTRNHMEMSRAQALQAQAAKIDPDCRMNPILIKPSAQMKMSLILDGVSEGVLHYTEYRQRHEALRQLVFERYDQLANEFDAVVLEGAGSPGEVNLRSGDLVNMTMARHAQAGVIMVGDIDRGGVFASLIGTMSVLAEWEREAVVGFLVNRFRGDASLLGEAFEYVHHRTGTPVLGTIPFIADLQLPEEDSVNFKDGMRCDRSPLGDRLDIAVIDLPFVSNFSDIDPLDLEPDVRIRTVSRVRELGQPHVILIPGSKQVVHDLRFLRESGLAEAITSLAMKKDAVLMGICGGFQMLGMSILDPTSVETSQSRSLGLGIFPMITEFSPAKTLRQRWGRCHDGGHDIRGFEIHHGVSDWSGFEPVASGDHGEPILGTHSSLWVWGTYLHGIFDGDGFRRWWLNRCRTSLGLPLTHFLPNPYDLEPALDRLAEVFRSHVDVAALYRSMSLK